MPGAQPVKLIMDPDHARIGFKGRWIPLLVVRSNRRTMGISVRPDLSVVLRLPRIMPLLTALRFLEQKKTWIYRKLDHFESLQHVTAGQRFVNGEVHYFLGSACNLAIEKGTRTAVNFTGNQLTITTPYPDDPDKIRIGYNQWLKAQAVPVFSEVHRELKDRYKPLLGYWLPEPKIRSYKRLWGRYENRGRTYTLNFHLVKAPLPAIEYVILHEICHRRIMRHDRSFYALLGSLMPDWKERKKRLEMVAI